MKINIFWFRRDLRFDDNHGLYQACKSELPVLPIFIFDTEILSEFQNPEDKRVVFIYNHLRNLNNSPLRKGGNIAVFYGKPEDIFAQLIETYQIHTVFYNNDYEPYAIEREKKIKKLLSKHNIQFLGYKDHVIFEPDEIVTKEGKPYTIFTPYMKQWKLRLGEKPLRHYPSEQLLQRFIDTSIPIPPLMSMGYKNKPFRYPPDLLNEQIIRNYHETRNFPALENGTSLLGIHFRFGTISIRKAVAAAIEWNETWLNELIWREFFMQILWYFPNVTHSAFKKKFNFISWRNNESEFQRFCRGETGFPMVDAGIHELLETGHMHNRVRMVVANFLSKLLLIDWQWGERFFAQHLLDYELASNNGNWQWCAGTGADAAPYFRIFNPHEQLKRFDPQEEYVRKWKGIQQGISPMIDYKLARNRCLEVYGNVKI